MTAHRHSGFSRRIWTTCNQRVPRGKIMPLCQQPVGTTGWKPFPDLLKTHKKIGTFRHFSGPVPVTGTSAGFQIQVLAGPFCITDNPGLGVLVFQDTTSPAAAAQPSPLRPGHLPHRLYFPERFHTLTHRMQKRLHHPLRWRHGDTHHREEKRMLRYFCFRVPKRKIPQHLSGGIHSASPFKEGFGNFGHGTPWAKFPKHSLFFCLLCASSEAGGNIFSFLSGYAFPQRLGARLTGKLEIIKGDIPALVTAFHPLHETIPVLPGRRRGVIKLLLVGSLELPLHPALLDRPPHIALDSILKFFNPAYLSHHKISPPNPLQGLRFTP